MTDWQPIETAPKDGTWVLTWTHLAGFDNEYMTMSFDHISDCGWVGGSMKDLHPEYWQPLPEPPMAQIKGDTDE